MPAAAAAAAALGGVTPSTAAERDAVAAFLQQWKEIHAVVELVAVGEEQGVQLPQHPAHDARHGRQRPLAAAAAPRPSAPSDAASSFMDLDATELTAHSCDAEALQDGWTVSVSPITAAPTPSPLPVASAPRHASGTTRTPPPTRTPRAGAGGDCPATGESSAAASVPRATPVLPMPLAHHGAKPPRAPMTYKHPIGAVEVPTLPTVVRAHGQAPTGDTVDAYTPDTAGARVAAACQRTLRTPSAAMPVVGGPADGDAPSGDALVGWRKPSTTLSVGGGVAVAAEFLEPPEGDDKRTVGACGATAASNSNSNHNNNAGLNTNHSHRGPYTPRCITPRAPTPNGDLTDSSHPHHARTTPPAMVVDDTTLTAAVNYDAGGDADDSISLSIVLDESGVEGVREMRVHGDADAGRGLVGVVADTSGGVRGSGDDDDGACGAGHSPAHEDNEWEGGGSSPCWESLPAATPPPTLPSEQHPTPVPTPVTPETTGATSGASLAYDNLQRRIAAKGAAAAANKPTNADPAAKSTTAAGIGGISPATATTADSLLEVSPSQTPGRTPGGGMRWALHRSGGGGAGGMACATPPSASGGASFVSLSPSVTPARGTLAAPVGPPSAQPQPQQQTGGAAGVGPHDPSTAAALPCGLGHWEEVDTDIFTAVDADVDPRAAGDVGVGVGVERRDDTDPPTNVVMDANGIAWRNLRPTADHDGHGPTVAMPRGASRRQPRVPGRTAATSGAPATTTRLGRTPSSSPSVSRGSSAGVARRPTTAASRGKVRGRAADAGAASAPTHPRRASCSRAASMRAAVAAPAAHWDVALEEDGVDDVGLASAGEDAAGAAGYNAQGRTAGRSGFGTRAGGAHALQQRGRPGRAQQQQQQKAASPAARSLSAARAVRQRQRQQRASTAENGSVHMGCPTGAPTPTSVNNSFTRAVAPLRDLATNLLSFSNAGLSKVSTATVAAASATPSGSYASRGGDSSYAAPASVCSSKRDAPTSHAAHGSSAGAQHVVVPCRLPARHPTRTVAAALPPHGKASAGRKKPFH